MKKITLIASLFILGFLYLKGGLSSIFLDTDMGRDLYQMSNIYLHKVVWLGPSLSAGFPTSPIYYYMFFPILYLAHGNANSLIVANIVIALAALLFFGVMAIKKWGRPGLLPVLAIGLSPWFGQLAVHPGNGYTYALWLFVSLTALWYRLPLFYGATFFGLAIAYHPAAILVLPIFLYEWWMRGRSLVQLLLSFMVFALPWSPIIVFEIITKAFLTRSFFAHTGTGLTFGIGTSNLFGILSLSGLPITISIVLLLMAAITATKRARNWIFYVFFAIIFLSFFKPMPPHYLLGVLGTLWFMMTIIFLKNNLTRIILLLLIAFYITKIILSPPVVPAKRSISKMQKIVAALILTGKIDRNKSIAPVAILSLDNRVPQADDYRFFLRMKGYSVHDVNDYNLADTLILFIEEPKFPWERWSSWETDRFGKKKEYYRTAIEGVKIVVYDKVK